MAVAGRSALAKWLGLENTVERLGKKTRGRG